MDEPTSRPAIAIVPEFDCAKLSYTGRAVHALVSGDFIVYDRIAHVVGEMNTVRVCGRKALPEWALNTLVNSGFYR